jgi:Protein of unknown function (DUF2971)
LSTIYRPDAGFLPRETDDLYHYTTASVGVESILAQMQFRVGLIELTNDPRESRARYPSLSLAEGVEVEDTRTLMDQADRLLRRAAKVACFTRDFALPDAALDQDRYRGWAHPSLWAHYGGSHAGVALRFSRQALGKRMKQYRVAPDGRCFDGPVTYDPDAFLTSSLVNFSVEQINEFGLDAVILDFIDRYHQQFFFEKHPDWGTELEYRWIMVDRRLLPIYVDISGCLTGMVLGDAFPDARLEAVTELALRHIIEVSRVFFRDGRVFRMPQVRAPAPPRAHRRTGTLSYRVTALKRAEKHARASQAKAGALAAPILGRLGELIRKVGSRTEAEYGLQVEQYGRVTAIPPIERRRAAGAPTQTSKWESGYLCVISKPALTPRSLCLSLAVQVRRGDKIKVHASCKIESRDPNDPATGEIWRGAEVLSSPEAETPTILVEFERHSRLAIESFAEGLSEECRQRPGPTLA